jgi:hypothetical protein
MKKRINPTARGIDDWKYAHAITNYETLFAPPAGKGIRARGPGIQEGMSLHFSSDYFEKAATVSSCWKPSIPFGQGLTVRCYTEAGK